MNDGWYRIVFPTKGHVVEFCHRNVFQSGSVPLLREEGCAFEPVHVLSERELEELIRYRVEERLPKTVVEPVPNSRWTYPLDVGHRR